MKGQHFTTIVQGVFCALLALVALGLGRPLPSEDAALAMPVAVRAERPRPPLPADHAADDDRRRLVRQAAVRPETPPPHANARTRVTLRSDDGAVWEVEYDLAPGDTLGVIADRFDVPLSRIMIANGIRNAHRIRAGMSLRIPIEIEALDHAIMAQLPAPLRESPERLRLYAYFDRWARAYDIDPDLLKALGWIESRWRYDVVSHRGAIGIGQLMPDTVQFVETLLGEELDPWTPEQNIQMSARFLRYLIDETGDIDEALAAYYQGLGALRAQGMYRTTRPYVRNVQAARRYFTAS